MFSRESVDVLFGYSLKTLWQQGFGFRNFLSFLTDFWLQKLGSLSLGATSKGKGLWRSDSTGSTDLLSSFAIQPVGP